LQNCVDHSMIQLTRSGTVFSGSPRDMEKLNRDFDRQHYVRLSSVLDPELLKWIQLRIERASFEPLTHGRIGTELCIKEDPSVDLMHFLVNTPKLYDLVERISGRRPIQCFFGRIYRMIADSGHFDSWHDDFGKRDKPRLVAMSINLSTEVYSGGVLQIREQASDRILSEVTNTGFGDAIIFRIERGLQHRITDVQGTAPKTAFAGWFESGPPFYELARM
jgi:hypothetical protein